MPDIVYRIEQTSDQWFDRQSIEYFFDLQKHSALKLMRQMGAGKRAKDRLIHRRDLLIFINRVAQSPAFYDEVARRERLAEKLGDAAATFVARQVLIPAPALPPPGAFLKGKSNSPVGFPLNATLSRGRLVIEFSTTEDLLRTLFAISQVASRDFVDFQKACEG